MEPQFDILGYLTPYDLIDFSFEEFEHYFVDIYPSTSTRHLIFKKYKHYLTDFQELVATDFVQWIGGSFVTDKNKQHEIS